MSDLHPRDSIPLKAIRDKDGLYVPRQLSRETALRLRGMGLIEWDETDYSENKQGPCGTVRLTRFGQRTIYDA